MDTFLGRVTKARILQAVTEAKGERVAERIAQKGDMAREAEALLADSGWLSEAIRTQPRRLAGRAQMPACPRGCRTFHGAAPVI